MLFQALLLPHVRAGLAKGGGVDLRAAAHIILAQLAASATLSDELLSGEGWLYSLEWLTCLLSVLVVMISWNSVGARGRCCQ